MNAKRSRYGRTLTDRTRRRFLRNVGLTAGAAAGFTALGVFNYSRDPVRRNSQRDPVHLGLFCLQDKGVLELPRWFAAQR